MPDLSQYDSSLSSLSSTLNNITSIYDDEIDYLSGAIDSISSSISGLSGQYWETGGDDSTCNADTAIIDTHLYVGCCLIQNGTSYFNDTVAVGCGIQIGSTSLNEQQLQALLQLIN